MRNQRWLPGLLRLVAGLPLAAVAPANAEDDGSRRRLTRSGGYFALEQNRFESESLNAWFDAQGHPLSQEAEGEGGGGGALMTFGRMVMDAGGSGVGGEEETASSELLFGYGMGHASVGYILAQDRLVRVYPLVGIGGAGGGLTITPRSGAETPAGEPDESEGEWGAALTTVGIGADLTLHVWRLGVVFGLRIGCYYGLLSFSRNMDDVKPPTGPFVRLIVGVSFDV
jgi:hypothetical protein